VLAAAAGSGSRGLLYAAAASGNTRVAQFLLDKGLPLQLPEAEPGADADDDEPEEVPETPLHTAAEHGHVPMVKLLLSRGAAVNDRSGFGLTALRSCLRAPRDGAALLQLLLAAGGDALEAEYSYFTA
jgi:ankyrin repeat protein